MTDQQQEKQSMSPDAALGSYLLQQIGDLTKQHALEKAQMQVENQLLKQEVKRLQEVAGEAETS